MTAASATPACADLNADGHYDFGPDVRLLLSAIAMFDGHSGLGKPIGVLRGSSAAAVQSHYGHPLHGRGRHRSDAYWKQLCELLDCERLTQRRRSVPQTKGTFAYATVCLTDAGERWLRQHGGDGDGDAAAMWLRPPVNLLPYLRKAPAVDPATAAAAGGPGLTRRLPANSDQQKLTASLMLCRSALATRHDVMPYMVASNQALEQLALQRPLDVSALRAAGVDGFSEAKLLQFGAAFVECIAR